MNPDEIKAFNDCRTEIDEIDSTISAEEELRSMQLDDEKEAATPQAEPKESVEEKEERAFANFVRGVKLESRANNLDLGSNGAVVPQTIANKIIEKVKDLCPVYSLSEIYNVKGTLVIPYYGEKSGEDVTCAYATEFTDLTSTAGKFTSVSLSSFLAGALTKVSKSLINRSQFDITSFVVNKVAASIAEFLEKELLTGTGTDACQGILTGATNIVTSENAAKITGDDLIDLQESTVALQSGAIKRVFDGNKPIFTLANILGLLPKKITLGHRSNCRLKIQPIISAKDATSEVWQACYLHTSLKANAEADELIDALYLLLCWCIENQYINLAK